MVNWGQHCNNSWKLVQSSADLVTVHPSWKLKKNWHFTSRVVTPFLFAQFKVLTRTQVFLTSWHCSHGQAHFLPPELRTLELRWRWTVLWQCELAWKQNKFVAQSVKNWLKDKQNRCRTLSVSRAERFTYHWRCGVLLWHWNKWPCKAIKPSFCCLPDVLKCIFHSSRNKTSPCHQTLKSPPPSPYFKKKPPSYC